MLWFIRLVFALLALLIAGCASLPEYALPHIEVMSSNEISYEVGFTYKELTVDDFRAPTLPKRLAGHEKQVYAHSSIQIRPTKDSRCAIHSDYSYYYNQVIWSGTITSLAFEAVMLPDSSWWNPAVPEKKTAYVLQHEQIHFALTELAARQLTRQARKDADAILVFDSTRQGVQGKILEKIRSLIQMKKEEMIKEHTALDQDASLYLDPEKQQWWYERVNDQLRNTAL